MHLNLFCCQAVSRCSSAAQFLCCADWTNLPDALWIYLAGFPADQLGKLRLVCRLWETRVTSALSTLTLSKSTQAPGSGILQICESLRWLELCSHIDSLEPLQRLASLRVLRLRQRPPDRSRMIDFFGQASYQSLENFRAKCPVVDLQAGSRLHSLGELHLTVYRP